MVNKEQLFAISRERAKFVVEGAVSMLERKIYPFDQKNILPDVILPENVEQGSLQHTLFLFYACSMDSMRLATKVYEAVRNISREVDFENIPCLTT